MATIRVQPQDFDIGAEITALTLGRNDIGGIACFVGTVRQSNKPADPPIAALTLEHYPAMTEQAMRRIAAEAQARWQLLGCTLVHRIGRLEPGANIVLVLAAAAHRQAALDATGFLIDWLKTKAPFWKKEIFSDGTEAWVAARAEDEQAASRWTG
jgi:molybdopterin synthase catalytic subunit